MYNYVKNITANNLLLLIILFVTPILPCKADQNIKLQKTQHAPVIDGKLNESCWQNATWHSGFTPINKEGEKVSATKFAVLFKNDILYLGVICKERPGEKTLSSKRERDGRVHADDSIEFMLMTLKNIPPDKNLIQYMHFIVNSAGQKYDAIRTSEIANKKWDASWRVKTQISSGKWTVEAAISCASLDIQSKDSAWRFNICRSKPGKKYASWSRTNSFHNYKNFPLITNIPETLQKNIFNFSGVYLKHKKGEVFLDFNLANNGIYSGQVNLVIITYDNKKVPKMSYTYFKTSPEHNNSFSIPLKIKKSGYYNLRCFLKDNSGNILKVITQKLTIKLSPLKIRVKKPCYRNNIYHTQNIKNIELTANVNLKDYNNCAIKAILAHTKSGMVLSRTKKKLKPNRNVKIFKISLPIKNLKKGSYLLTVKLERNGSKIAQSTRIIRKLGPAPGSEVRFDENLNWLVNGKRFFPWGFMGARFDYHTYINKHGFNTIQSYIYEYRNTKKALESLDKWHKAGIKVILYPYYKSFAKDGHFTGPNAPGLTKDGLNKLETRIKSLMRHPAILGWYLCDEPRGKKRIQALEQVYHLIKRIDPYHPCIVLNNSADGCLDIQNAGDVLYPDIYPNFNINGYCTRPLSIVSSTINTVYRGSNYSKPVMFAAQTFDFGAYNSPELFRAPTYEETRCMIYLALLSNAKGLVNFKIGYDHGKFIDKSKSAGIFATKSLSIGMLEGLGPEIKALMPALLSGNSKKKVKINNKKIMTLLKINQEGNLYLFCVNSSNKMINAKISITGLANTKLNVFPEARSVYVKNDNFYDKFKPYDVHVYTNAEVKRYKTVKEIQTEIQQANNQK